MFPWLAGREKRPPASPTGLQRQFIRRSIARLGLTSILNGHDGCVNTCHWNADGSLLASGSDDKRVNLWRFETERQPKLVQSLPTKHRVRAALRRFGPCSFPLCIFGFVLA